MLNDVLFNVLSDVVGDIDDGPINPDLLVSFRAGSLVNYGVEGGTADLSLSSGTVQKSYLDAGGVLRFMDQDAGLRPSYVDGEYRGWLFEPGATNLITDSVDFDVATTAWANSVGGTGLAPVVVSTDSEAPDGSLTATRFQFDLDGGTDSSDRSTIQHYIGSLTNPHTGTISLWIKSGTGADQKLWIRDFVSGTTGAEFTATSEWQRVSLASEILSTYSTITLGLRGTESSVDTADVVIWGAQLEEGIIATSYIPTNGAAAVREDETNQEVWTLTDAVKAALGSGGTGVGRLEVEYAILWDKADVDALGGSHGIVSVRGDAGSLLYVGSDGAPITVDSGGNYTKNFSTAYTAYAPLKTVVTWDGSAASNGLTIATTLNGSTETDATDFDGAFTLGDDLILGYGTGFPFAIKSIKLRKGVS